MKVDKLLGRIRIAIKLAITLTIIGMIFGIASIIILLIPVITMLINA